MNFQFEKATKEQIKLRMALVGPTGSGKTFTALKLATQLGNRVAVIDTENSSASRYADYFTFERLNLEHHSPESYVKAIHAAEKAGFDCLVIDSLSHAWMGSKDGALALVDKAAKRFKGNSFAAWRDVTPLHSALVDALLHCKCHLFVTMRVKTEYVIEKDEKGRSTPKKVGLAPIMRDGIEYEFDVVGDMDESHNLIVSKTRCSVLDGEVIRKPGEELAQTLKAWLTDGTPAQTAKPQQPNAGEDFAIDLDEDEDFTNDAGEVVASVPEALMKRFHALGSELYGKKLWEPKRAELSSYISQGRVTSSKLLSREELQELVDGLAVKVSAAHKVLEAPSEQGAWGE